jgi:hypothetical protein
VVVVSSSRDSVVGLRVVDDVVEDVLDDVVDDVVASGSLMSVVAGGTVLVIVSVVVVGADVERSEKLGVTNSVGACWGWLNCRVTNRAPQTIRAIAARAATLTAASVDVRSCHFRSPVTGTDSNRADRVLAESTEFADDLRGEELQVIEV